MAYKGSLTHHCGGDGIHGFREGDEEGVALGVDLATTGHFEGIAQQLLVLVDDLPIATAQLPLESG
jgi:hypothetical protein